MKKEIETKLKKLPMFIKFLSSHCDIIQTLIKSKNLSFYLIEFLLNSIIYL